MAPFTLHFEWPGGGGLTAHRAYLLAVTDLEAAKLEAAMMYAGATFMEPPPTAYRITNANGETVYRYPEPSWKPH